MTKSKNRRRAEISIEQLEGRTLLTTVILADLDTGATQLQSFASYTGSLALPTTPLAPYLTQQYSTINGPAVPEAAQDHMGVGRHGTVMAAYYALLMQETGDHALVQEIAVGSRGVISSDAIGRALQFVAAEQVAANQAGTGIRYVVSIPIGPGVWGMTEMNGRLACLDANIPMSEASGNNGLPYAIPNFANSLIAEAVSPTGSFYSYSNVGPYGTAIVVPSYDLGTSGASLAGAAWLTKELEAYPTITATNAVSTLHNAGPLGLIPHSIAPPTPLIPKPVAHKPALKPVVQKVIYRPVAIHQPLFTKRFTIKTLKNTGKSGA